MSLCSSFAAFFLIHICLLLTLCFAEDPFVTYSFEISYITASPLGVPQQVCSLSLCASFFYILLASAFSTLILEGFLSPCGCLIFNFSNMSLF